MATAPRLDPEVVALVLQHVSLQQRMRSCALVCSDWRAGAALATQQIIVRKCTQPKAMTLAAWLRSNASHIRRTNTLELWCPGKQKGQPWPAVAWSSMPWEGLQGLQHVNIFGIAAATPAATAAAAAAPAVLGALTSLELAHTGLSFLGVVAMPALRKLVCIAAGTGKKHKQADVGAACKALALALPQLQSLTALKLQGGLCDAQAFAAISRLTELQHLELNRPGTKACTDLDRMPLSTLASLPASLTHLEVAVPNLSVNPPALQQLTALQELKLQYKGSLESSVLSSMSSMRKLVLREAELRPASGASLALQPFSELTQLEHLELAVAFSGAASLSAANAACLTASSHLTSLQLQQDMLSWPSQAFTTIFSGCQLPDLQNLAIGPRLLSNVPAMQQMVHCCPKLRRLVLRPPGDVDEGPDLSVQPDVPSQSLEALAALTGLQELLLPKTRWPFAQQGWAALAACSRLVQLSVIVDVSSTLGAMQEIMQGITKLRQLSRLDVMTYTEPYDPMNDCSCTRNMKAQPHSASDVWWQAPVKMMQSLANEYSDNRHDGWDWTLEGTINATPAAARQFIKELEDELAQLPQQPLRAILQGHPQDQPQPDGPFALLTRAIQGFKEGLAAFEETVKETSEREAGRDEERAALYQRASDSEEELNPWEEWVWEPTGQWRHNYY